MDTVHGTVETGSFSMRYFRFGKGERTAVILPGLGIKSVMDMSDGVAREYSVMEDDFTVYVFDRREDIPEGYTVRGMASDTAEALSHLGLGEICLFGASQGGMIAMAMAADHPELIRKLALASTAARVGRKEYRTVGRWADLAQERKGVELCLDFGEKIYPPGMFRMFREFLTDMGRSVTDGEFDRFIALAEATRGFDVTEDLCKIRCPVMVTGSDDDMVLGKTAARGIVRGLGRQEGVEFHMYKGCGHAAYDTAPDFRRRLYAFFMKDDAEYMK